MNNPNNPIFKIDASQWRLPDTHPEWIKALEAGKVLYFPNLAFSLSDLEKGLLNPEIQNPGTRSVTLDADDKLRGVNGGDAQQLLAQEMIARFRQQSMDLLHSLLPNYKDSLRFATTSYRPLQVETRQQSWRADDRRLHVDAIAGRPNHGTRILRVFANINPHGVPRVWRVGEPFETVVNRFLPKTEPYSRLEAWKLRLLMKTKTLRTEYDHLMLQIHDCMKLDMEYQKAAEQVTMPFAAGSTWVCFSDQASHAAMSGQYMLEQTIYLPVTSLYDPQSSPLSILNRVTGRALA